MKTLSLLAAGACGMAAIALAFAAWLSPDNAYALSSLLAFCR